LVATATNAFRPALGAERRNVMKPQQQDPNSPFFNDPDAQNSEQREEDAQAHSVEQDAELAGTDLSEESEPGGKTNPAQITPDDVPDLVDQMNGMRRSGHIDMDAYRGEPDSMDDEDGSAPE
jgi:hypothetical protein